jgi:hypothetical protein
MLVMQQLALRLLTPLLWPQLHRGNTLALASTCNLCGIYPWYCPSPPTGKRSLSTRGMVGGQAWSVDYGGVLHTAALCNAGKKEIEEDKKI